MVQMQEDTAHFFIKQKASVFRLFSDVSLTSKNMVHVYIVLYLVVLHTFAFQASKQKDCHRLFATGAPTPTELTVLWFRHH